MKTSILKLLVMIVSFFYFNSLFSQDSIYYEDFIPQKEKLTNVNPNSIYLKYSTISGQGIGIARYFYGFTVVFTGMIQYNENITWEDMSKTKVTYENSKINYNYGFELQYIIVETNTTNIFSFVGVNKGKETNKEFGLNNSNKSYYALGGGFGLQWFVHQSFNFELAFGYKYDDIETINNSSFSVERKTGIGAGFGIRYNF